MATREQINDAVKAMLETATGCNIGLGEIPVFEADPLNPPEGWPGKKYGVLYPLNVTPEMGSMDDGDEENDYLYQVSNVGDDVRRTGWMSAKTKSAFMALKPGGGYLHNIDLEGHAVTMRFLDSLGSIVPSGEDHFASADSYRLRICRD